MLPLLRATLDLFAEVLPLPDARQLVLDGQRIAYTLVRGKRRSIAMLVTATGLEVRAPRWVSLRAIESALHEKAPWIVRQLHKQSQRNHANTWQHEAWHDGGQLPYLGRPLRLRLGSEGGMRRAAWLADDGAALTLQLPIAPDSPADVVRQQAQNWLRAQARAHLQARLEVFAPLLQVRWQRLRLSSARTRWGSASADGTISLNWRLIHLPPELVDYVVVHELSHLRVLDHSPRFWTTVEGVMPDYRQRRAQLRQQAVPLAPGD